VVGDEVDGCGGDGVEVGEGGGRPVVEGEEEVTGGGVGEGCGDEVDGCGGDGVEVGEGGGTPVVAGGGGVGCGTEVDGCGANEVEVGIGGFVVKGEDVDGDGGNGDIKISTVS
jgi:hypothetical protein